MNMIETDKQAILNNTCTIPTKIKIYNNNVLETTLTEEDYILDWNHEDFRYVPNEGFIGQFVERIVDGHLKNVNDSFTLVDKEIEVEYGVTAQGEDEKQLLKDVSLGTDVSGLKFSVDTTGYTPEQLALSQDTYIPNDFIVFNNNDQINSHHIIFHWAAMLILYHQEFNADVFYPDGTPFDELDLDTDIYNIDPDDPQNAWVFNPYVFTISGDTQDSTQNLKMYVLNNLATNTKFGELELESGTIFSTMNTDAYAGHPIWNCMNLVSTAPENTNWYSLGRFIVSSTEDDNVKDTMSFKAVDYTKKFEKKYESTLTFPTTAAALAYDCCNQCGVELDTNGRDGIFKTEDEEIDDTKKYYIAETEDKYEEYLLKDIEDLSILTDSELKIDTGTYTGQELTDGLVRRWYSIILWYTNYPNEYTLVGVGSLSSSGDIRYPNNNNFDKEINQNHKYIYAYDQNNVVYVLCDLTIPETYGNLTIPQNATNMDIDSIDGSELDKNSIIWNCIKTITQNEQPTNRYNYVTNPIDDDIDNYYEMDFGFKNQDFIIDGNPYTNNETCREVMKDIGKLAFSWIRIDENNKCCIDFTKETEVDEYDEINYNMYYDLQTTGTIYGGVTKVIVGMKDIDGENVTIVDPNYVEGTKETELGIWDNHLTYTQQKRLDVINQGSFLFGYNYQEVDLTTIGHPWLTGKERILIKDMEQNDIYTYPFNRTLSYMGHIKTKIQAPATSETNTKYTYDGKISEAVKNTQIIVNKAEGQITSLTSRTDVLENKTKDTYSIEQINELVQTAVSGLTNTFTQSGGNNIFRNTGLWFETNDSNNPYEFWSGLVERTKETKASNMNGMLLQNGTLKQTQMVANGIYTIAFKYKKPIALSIAKVYINDIEYDLVETDDTEFIKTITVTSESIDIKFTCDINNGCEIYDLMGNVGDVGLAYTQNQNETTTDTVNISTGITITSSDTNTTFKAQSDGIRVFNSRDLDNPVTEFVDTGMITDEATIKNKSQIVGTLWQEVDGQTWITRL